MKLLRYGMPGEEKPGCLDKQGNIRDLSSYVPDIAGQTLMPSSLDQLRSLDVESLPCIKSSPRIGPCVGQVGKFLCVGLNYIDHAAEVGIDLPSEPVVFSKATSAICGPYDPLIIPKGSTRTDWEVELGVIIGARGKRITQADAFHHVAGYCVVNDVSERHYQLGGGGQWFKGKSCDTFGPIGPWLVTADEVLDPQKLSLWLEVDGKRYQNGYTENMIYHVSYLISYLSQYFTLYPGDIISTGTPAGVGWGQKPESVYLRAGQVVKFGINGLGVQEHLMVEEGLSV